MKRKLAKRLYQMVPFGQFLRQDWLRIHVLILLLQTQFRITVTAVVWKRLPDGARAALVIEKQVPRVWRGAVYFPIKPDLPKGGWRDEPDFRSERLIEAMYRELREECGITKDEVRRHRVEGIAFHPLNKHNRWRHPDKHGKLLIVLSVEVDPATQWRQGSEVKIVQGFFTPTPQAHFEEGSAKRAILNALGWE